MADFIMVEHGLTCCDNYGEVDGQVVCYCGNCAYRDYGMPECRVRLKTDAKDKLQSQCIEISRLNAEIMRLKKKAGEVEYGDAGRCEEVGSANQTADGVSPKIIAFPTANRSVTE